MFESDPLYTLRPSDDTDADWNVLLPPGRGFVYVSDSEKRGLPRGQKVKHGEIYSVAMYHQLHCLARMRKMHWLYLDAITTGEMAMAKSVSGRTQSDHVQHCIDYLRQSILCNGDMTLEWPKLDGVSSGVKVDGWNIPHTCKSPVSFWILFACIFMHLLNADDGYRLPSMNLWTSTITTKACPLMLRVNHPASRVDNMMNKFKQRRPITITYEQNTNTR